MILKFFPIIYDPYLFRICFKLAIAIMLYNQESYEKIFTLNFNMFSAIFDILRIHSTDDGNVSPSKSQTTFRPSISFIDKKKIFFPGKIIKSIYNSLMMKK